MDKINFVNGTAPALNAINLNQLQTNIENAINDVKALSEEQYDILNEKIEQRITTETEFATNEWIDGSQVFRKRFNTGNLPNNSSKTISTGLDFVNTCKLVRFQGAAQYPNGICIPLPLVETNEVRISISNNNINISTVNDRSAATGHIDLYYTKN